MDAAVTAALISGGFAVVGPLVTYFATKAYEQRFLDRISAGRQRALTGSWEGLAQQDEEPGEPSIEARVLFQFEVQRKVLLGDAEYSASVSGEKYEIRLKTDGCLLHDRFLRLNYRNVDDATIQFGTVVAELDPDGKTLVGRYAGFGATTKRLVVGRFTATKKA